MYRQQRCRATAARGSMTCLSRQRKSALLCSTPFTANNRSVQRARLVARHLTLGHSPDALIATLGQALLREDAGFHAYQMLEAGVRQFHERATATRAGIFLLP